jgi:hypothetical protein
MGVFILLLGSQSVQQPVVPYGGSPGVMRSPTLLPPPPVGFLAIATSRCKILAAIATPKSVFLTPHPQQVLKQWTSLMSWRHPPERQPVMPWGMPLSWNEMYFPQF